MNDLVERYLNSIKHLLPHGQQDDIVAELADEIQSRIEEKEAELGRKLKPDEIEAVLKSLGGPATVAARYGSNRYLIGPTVFPVYWLALRTLLAVVLLAVAAGGVIRTAVSLARGEPTTVAHGLAQTFGDLYTSAFFIVGFVTVVAAVIERVRPDLLDGDWLIDGLARAPKGLTEASDAIVAKAKIKAQAKAQARAGARRATRTPTQIRVEGAFGVLINVVFFVWLAAVIEAPAAVPDYLSPEQWMETTGLAFAPIWREQLFPLVLAGVAARALLHLTMLLWPRSQRRYAAAKLLGDAASIATAWVAVQAGLLFEPGPGLTADLKVAEVLAAVNMSLHLGFAFVGVITALDALYQLWRLAGPRAKPAAV